MKLYGGIDLHSNNSVAVSVKVVVAFVMRHLWPSGRSGGAAFLG